MVVNAPTSNIVSAAELAVALMLAAARHVAPANAALKNGEWKRSKYTGIELYEKTVGIVGLGRIGVLVAQRLGRLRHEGHRLRPLRAGRARRADGRAARHPRRAARRSPTSCRCTCPRRPETVGLIGDDELHKVKPSLVLVNAARGGIVDEHALYVALKEGRIAGAGLDVFASEPCTDSAAVRVRERRGHPAPRRVDRRGAGEGRHRGRQVGPARAVRRARAGRGQRPGRCDRRGRPARASR